MLNGDVLMNKSYMGGVDLNDQLHGYQMMRRKFNSGEIVKEPQKQNSARFSLSVGEQFDQQFFYKEIVH